MWLVCLPSIIDHLAHIFLFSTFLPCLNGFFICFFATIMLCLLNCYHKVGLWLGLFKKCQEGWRHKYGCVENGRKVTIWMLQDQKWCTLWWPIYCATCFIIVNLNGEYHLSWKMSMLNKCSLQIIFHWDCVAVLILNTAVSLDQQCRLGVSCHSGSRSTFIYTYIETCIYKNVPVEYSWIRMTVCWQNDPCRLFYEWLHEMSLDGSTKFTYRNPGWTFSVQYVTQTTNTHCVSISQPPKITNHTFYIIFTLSCLFCNPQIISFGSIY